MAIGVQWKEGLGIGIPLGPTMANNFMCNFETIYLDECPLEFQPIFYKRYIDDTFLLFKRQIKSKHNSMKIETNNKLSFLDCTVTRLNNDFKTSVYRKYTFTGLGISYFRFCPKLLKINNVKTAFPFQSKVMMKKFLKNTEIYTLSKRA